MDSYLDFPPLTAAPAEPYAGLKEETVTVADTRETKGFIGGQASANYLVICLGGRNAEWVYNGTGQRQTLKTRFSTMVTAPDST